MRRLPYRVRQKQNQVNRPEKEHWATAAARARKEAKEEAAWQKDSAHFKKVFGADLNKTRT